MSFLNDSYLTLPSFPGLACLGSQGQANLWLRPRYLCRPEVAQGQGSRHSGLKVFRRLPPLASLQHFRGNLLVKGEKKRQRISIISQKSASSPQQSIGPPSTFWSSLTCLMGYGHFWRLRLKRVWTTKDYGNGICVCVSLSLPGSRRWAMIVGVSCGDVRKLSTA